jgi:hypothetical protein
MAVRQAIEQGELRRVKQTNVGTSLAFRNPTPRGAK